jgi:hypothetical protein
MVKATRLIANKGYSWSEANEIAIACFDQANRSNMSVEWVIDKIANKESAS